MLANISYFVVLDKVGEIETLFLFLTYTTCKSVVGMSNTVALDFGHAMFGPIGGSIFALIVAISCFGALNGQLLSSST